jgi:hypothetical protein
MQAKPNVLEPSEKPSRARPRGRVGPEETAETKPSEPASSGESYVLKFSANDPADSTYDKLVIQILQQKLEEKSNGRLALEVYYSSSLAKQGECLDAIKNGTVDMGVDIPAMYPGQFLYTELFGSPGINLGNAEEVTYTMAAYMEAFPESGMEDFKIICRFSSGTFGLLSADKPITKVSDLAACRSVRPAADAMVRGDGRERDVYPMATCTNRSTVRHRRRAHAVGRHVRLRVQEVANYFTPLTMMNGDSHRHEPGTL